MIGVSVKSKKAAAQLGRFISGLDSAIDRGLMQTAFKGQSVAKSKSKGSVAASVGVTQTKAGYELQARAPHARWVEDGRGPVVAKRAKMLRFEVGGRVLFRKRVGPARARPFMAPAARVMGKSRFVEMSLSSLARVTK